MANFPKNYNFDALATLLNKRASYVRILSVDCKSHDDLLRSINIAGILEGIPPTMFQVLSRILEPIERRPADRSGTEAPDGATYVSEAHAEADSLHGEKNAFRGDEDGCVIIPALARRL